MTDTGAVAFWSYARLDDERDFGRIVRLAELVTMEYGLITGSEIEIFVDRHDLRWGEVWRERIEEALQSTTFFIPIATPTYFQRDECRKELWQFHSAARALGVGDLIMPIVYQTIADFTEENPNDAIALAAKMHVEFFDEVRLEDESTAVHRKAVHRLAARLAELTEEIAQRPAVVPTAPAAVGAAVSAETDSDGQLEEEDADAPGTLDLLAALEPDLQAWSGSAAEFRPVMARINDRVVEHTQKMHEPENASFARRVLVARQLAAALDEPAAELEALGERYATQVRKVDPAVRAMILLARSAKGEDEAEAEVALKSILGLAATSREAVVSVREFVRATRETQKLSRDLRPVLTRINTAVMNVVDAQSIIDGWEDEARGADS